MELAKMIETTKIYVDTYDIPMPEVFETEEAAIEWLVGLSEEAHADICYRFKKMRARLVKRGLLDMDKF